MNNGFKKFLSIVLSTVMVVSSMTFAGLTTVSAADAVTIYDCKGAQEAAFVEWAAVSGTDHYYVSYSKDGSNYTQIDDVLIRKYNDRWRADLVGLSAGDYSIKVTCKDASGVVIAETTSNCTVIAHDRTGFTFDPSSILSHADDRLQSGAYNGDGTLKSGANVIYITKASDIDTVTYEGFTGLSTILQNRHKQSSAPLNIRMMGKLNYSGSQLNSKGYIQVKPSKSYTDINTTIEGIGSDTTINFGLLLRNAGNVEIRNLAVHDFKDDGISLDTDNANIWIHNCDFFYGIQGSGDKAKGDGSSDIKMDSKYVTLSYNHYWDSGKCSLCGMKSETGENFITYHHNWFDHSDSRHPRIRTMSVHVFNNYYDGNAKYGIGTSANSNAFVENNYFRNAKYPTLQGSAGHDSDGKGGSNTFDDSPAIGAIKLYGNVMTGSNTKFIAGTNGETASDADGCVATARDEVLNYTTSAGATYNNFDTKSSYIQGLTIETAEEAKNTVEAYAGRISDDFSFNFTDADDTDYEINTALRAALTAYVNDNKLVSVGGASDGSGPVTTEATTTEITTEVGTETTTEEITETTTYSTPVDVSDAQTGFDPATDSGSGISVNYYEESGRWTLRDTSSSASATLSIPFAEQTSGKIVISGTVEPSVVASKWAFVQIRGKMANGTEGEIVSFASDENKKLAVRNVVNGTSTYNTLNVNQAAKDYSYTIIVDLDAKTATLNVDGLSKTVNIDVSSISSFFTTTSKSVSRNVSVSVPYVGVLSDNPNPQTTTEATTVTEATTEATTVTETTTEATTVTEATTEATTVTETTTEETTEEQNPDPVMVYGDVDGNGERNINDVSVLLNSVLSGNVEAKNGINDVDGNGKVDSADVAILLQKVLSDSWKMPCEPDETETTTVESTTEATTITESTTVVTVETTEATTAEVTTVATTVEPTTEVTTAEVTTQTTTVEATTEVTTAEVTTQTTTVEATTEATTAEQSSEVTTDGNSDTYYDFNDSPVITKDGTSGITYAVTTKTGSVSDGLTAEAVIANNNGSNAVYLNDVSATDTVKLTLPLTEKASGKVTYTAKITPSVASTNWTIAQLNGLKADDTEGEVLGIRTDGSKNYGIRVNAGSTVTATTVASAANTQATIVITVDFDNDTATLSVNGGAAVTATGVDAKSITSMSFQTATGARSLYVDDAGITAGSVETPSETTTSDISSETTTEGSSESSTEAPTPSANSWTASDAATPSWLNLNGATAVSNSSTHIVFQNANGGNRFTQRVVIENSSTFTVTPTSAGTLKVYAAGNNNVAGKGVLTATVDGANVGTYNMPSRTDANASAFEIVVDSTMVGKTITFTPDYATLLYKIEF